MGAVIFSQSNLPFIRWTRSVSSRFATQFLVPIFSQDKKGKYIYSNQDHLLSIFWVRWDAVFQPVRVKTSTFSAFEVRCCRDCQRRTLNRSSSTMWQPSTKHQLISRKRLQPLSLLLFDYWTMLNKNLLPNLASFHFLKPVLPGFRECLSYFQVYYHVTLQ